MRALLAASLAVVGVLLLALAALAAWPLAAEAQTPEQARMAMADLAAQHARWQDALQLAEASGLALVGLGLGVVAVANFRWSP